MIIELGENLPDKLKDVVDNQLDYLKMEFQKIGEISLDIDQSKVISVANTETNIRHNRYRDMGKFVTKILTLLLTMYPE